MNIIETISISKKFGSFIALENINLNVERSEFFGCFGPNGAGKTTLLKILTGQIEPSNGIAKVLGFDVVKNPIAAKKLVGIVPEVESPPSYLTGEEYLYFVGKVREIKHIEKEVMHWLDFFELTDKKDTLCKDMSKGMRQKLMLASAFIHKPALLFLDEPLINLDPVYQRKLKDYLGNYVRNGGTVFMCSHLLEIAEKLCTRVAILNNGKIIAQGKLQDLKRKENDDLESIFLRLVGD